MGHSEQFFNRLPKSARALVNGLTSVCAHEAWDYIKKDCHLVFERDVAQIAVLDKTDRCLEVEFEFQSYDEISVNQRGTCWKLGSVPRSPSFDQNLFLISASSPEKFRLQRRIVIAPEQEQAHHVQLHDCTVDGCVSFPNSQHT